MTLHPSHEGLHEAYAHWLRVAKGVAVSSQHPAEELLGEHYVMRRVLAAMEKEAAKLAGGAPMRSGFWAEVVDFIGNFVHQSHRTKEQEQLFPAAVERGGLAVERSQELAHEHAGAKQMTLDLVAGIEEGDPKVVLRNASAYIAFLREHMLSEEKELLGPMRDELSADDVQRVRAAFDEIEEDRLVSGRLHYVELARELCKQAGVEDDLD